MTKDNPYLELEKKHFLYTFKRQPLLIKKGKGSYVWDEKGKKYLDFFSGLAVCGVGHAHPRVVRAIQKQSAQLIHSSNYFYTRPQFELAKALTKRFSDSRVFFANSGAEVNELAVKLARLWAHHHKKPGREIITFHKSFHGRTLAMSAASDGASQKNSVFAPLPQGFLSVPFNDLNAVKKAINKKTIAIMLEPVQGEGGINIATQEFFKGIASLCKKHKILLIADEVQSGLGRTGTFFAFEQYGVTPDIVTLAKGLAGGLPLGATLVKTHIAQFVVPGLHGSTFGGNPVACAASLEVLKMITPRSLRAIQMVGKVLVDSLQEFRVYPVVTAIRGHGLMACIEINTDGMPYVNAAREKGLLINCTQGNVLRFLPPYFISARELKMSLKILHSVFKNLTKI